MIPSLLYLLYLTQTLKIGKVLSAINESISHCLIYEEYPKLEVVCLKCEKSYVLNQFSTSCEPRIQSEPLLNCIQISTFGDCMLCDCGYAIQESLGRCVLSPNQLVGCEKFIERANNLCTRPKRDYLLLKGNQGESMVLFARGSHCEIFDGLSDRCIQCHSGYLLSQDYHCKRYPHRIFNEYFSFFTLDGELQSRSLLFTAQSDGVYPKINNCLVYKKIKNKFALECELCNTGRVLSQNKTECLKQLVDFCKIVENTNGSIEKMPCAECLDNDHFYLSRSSSDPKEQICLPRQQQFEPTTRCLVHFDNLPGCQTCALGLFSTSTGCSLENPRLFSSESPLQPQQISEFYFFYDSCEYQINDNICGSCKKQMIPNDKGRCMYKSDKNCLLGRENGSCAQCISLMYYSETQLKCVFIDSYLGCRHSLGKSNSCEICIESYYPIESGICKKLDIQGCTLSLGKERKCEICSNLHYLTEEYFCCQITAHKYCLISNGVTDGCFKCVSGYVADETGNCIPIIEVEDNICNSPLFFLECQDGDCSSSSSGSARCVQYNFDNSISCDKFHPNKSECLECVSSFYLFYGACYLINYCSSSDGVSNQCYSYSYEISFLDKDGKLNVITKTCDESKRDIKCASCFLEDRLEGILVNHEQISASPSQEAPSFDSVCTPFNEVSFLEVFPNCLHLSFSDNSYKCILCVNLYYLAEKGECKAFPKDSKCELSDGISLKCQYCRKRYKINALGNDQYSCQLDKIKDIAAIPFCKIQQGIECKKCRNLYYIAQNHLCYPIFDPDCETSNGIIPDCQRCKNGQMMVNQQYLSSICNSNICTSFDSKTGQCTECINGYVLVEIKDEQRGLNNQTSTFRCIQKTPQCQLQDQFMWCTQCPEGQYFDQERNRKHLCLKIPIENCIVFDKEKYVCSKCAEGYDLLQSGLCFKLTRCLEYHEGCLKCQKEFFLKDGVCIKIFNCIEQIYHQCLLCAPGYWVRSYENKAAQSTVQDFAVSHDICQKIPHCANSDGLIESCIACESGFDLQNEICIQENSQRFNNCLISNETNDQCVQCQNLFFITNGSCIEISEWFNCERNDGINDSCRICSFHGFILQDNNTCIKINNCVVSNGIDVCIICEENFIVNNLTGRCDQLTVQIANCQVVSYDKMTFHRKDGSDEEGGNSLKRSKEVPHEESNNPQPASSSDNNEPTTDNLSYSNQIQRCSQCENFFYLKNNQLECLRAPSNRMHNCIISNGQSQNCAACSQGYVLLERYEDEYACSSQNKKLNKRIDQRCQLFNQIETIECAKCQEGFFMTQTHPRQCKYRSKEDTKCLRFSPRKDECEICRSGYKKKEFQGQNNLKFSLCMQLEAREQVRNCGEYSPGTDKCIKCQNNIGSYDVVEYVLDEEKNICINVLGLMCKIIDANKKQCVEFFIPNCEIAIGRQCDTCKNGFYLAVSSKSSQSSTGYSTDSCLKHQIISHCLIYSQTNQDSCEICEEYYELLEENKEKLCSQIHQQNCKRTHRSMCVECSSDRFAIDVKRGTCVESQIFKCAELEIQQQLSQETQICLKCYSNYVLSENKTECIWRLPDENCLQSDQFRICLVCKEGYFITKQGDCLKMHSPCSLQNCMKYSEISNPDQMVCEECQINYELDQNQGCLLLDKHLQSTEKQRDSENDKENNNIIKGDPYFQLQWIFFLLSLVIVIVLVCWLIKVLRNKRKDKDQKDKSSKASLSVEIEIPVDQSMEMNSNIADMRRDDGIEGAVSHNNISYIQFESDNE